MIKKHIEIVSSDKVWLSSMSRESREAALSVLSQHYETVGITMVNNLADLKGLVASSPDLVLLGMKFILLDDSLGLKSSNKLWISDVLEEHGIAYTGSDRAANELEHNKPLAKQRILDAGLRTSPYHVARRGHRQDWEKLNLAFPVFIKPTNRGGGLGVDSDSVAHTYSQLEAKISSLASTIDSDSLIEGYLDGREFSVAILQEHQSDKYSVMPIELVPELDSKGFRLLSEEVKSSNTEVALAVLDLDVKTKITSLAISVFQALGARNYGRIDIRLDGLGNPHFLEANLMPSLISGYGSFPKACLLNINMDYETMLLHIVGLGLERSRMDFDINLDVDDNLNSNLPNLGAVLGSI